MIEPTQNDIGRNVVYRDARRQMLEEGVITSFNPYFVFVRYGSQTYSAATAREDLEWVTPPSQEEGNVD